MKQTDKANPWLYKPNTSKIYTQSIHEAIKDDLDIFVDIEEERECEVYERLLKNHTQSSAVFLRRLLDQKLSETLEMVNYDCKSDFLKETLSQIVHFLVTNPDFFMHQHDDGYIYFENLVRSEIYFLLDAILKRRELEVLQAANINSKEMTQVLAKIVAVKQTSDSVHEYLEGLLESILGKEQVREAFQSKR